MSVPTLAEYQAALQAHAQAKQAYQQLCEPLMARALTLMQLHRSLLEPLYEELSALDAASSYDCEFGSGRAGSRFYNPSFSVHDEEVIVCGEQYMGCNEYEQRFCKLPVKYFCEDGEALIQAEAQRLREQVPQLQAQQEEARQAACQAQEREELARLKAKYEG